MTAVYFLKFTHPLSSAAFESKLRSLPIGMQAHVTSFRRWENSHESLFGKLLLSLALDDLACRKTLNDVTYSEHGRPTLEDIGINISHSNRNVCCVVSTDTTYIGIDVEMLQAIDIQDYTSIFTPSEWLIVNQDLKSFYRHWTSKEAIAKCLGQGMFIPLKEIEIHDDCGLYQGQSFFLRHLDFGNDVSVTIGSDKELGTLKLNDIDVGSL